MRIGYRMIHKNAIEPRLDESSMVMKIYSKSRMIIWPNNYDTLETGMVLDIPEGYTGVVYVNENICLNYGITGFTVIDHESHEELKLKIFNNGNVKRIIEHGELIALVKFHKSEQITLEKQTGDEICQVSEQE